jgi:2-methylcitrate dehydratase PrpD
VDRFIHIIEENDLSAEDVEEVKVAIWEGGTTSFPFCNDNHLDTKEDICFNIAYLLACAACRHDPARWHDDDVFHDVRVRKFMQKVDKIMEPDQRLLRIEVAAKDGRRLMAGGGCSGGVCEIKPEEKTIHGGMEFPEEKSREKLLDKFISMASRTLSLDQSNEVIRTVLELEKLENVSKLMRMVTP